MLRLNNFFHKSPYPNTQVVDKIRRAGVADLYFLGYVKLCPSHWGEPVTRRRIYILLLRKSLSCKVFGNELNGSICFWASSDIISYALNNRLSASSIPLGGGTHVGGFGTRFNSMKACATSQMGLGCPFFSHNGFAIFPPVDVKKSHLIFWMLDGLTNGSCPLLPSSLPRDVIKKEIKKDATFIQQAQRSIDAMSANQECGIEVCNP